LVDVLLSNFTMLLAYCTIACTFAKGAGQQPCPAALPGSLARQPCPAALPGSLARQPCPPALPASLARQPCPPALPGSLASCFTAAGMHAGSIAYFFSAGSLVQAFPAIKDMHCDFKPCVRIDIDL
jgi:hypothetical protein